MQKSTNRPLWLPIWRNRSLGILDGMLAILRPGTRYCGLNLFQKRDDKSAAAGDAVAAVLGKVRFGSNWVQPRLRSR